MPEPVAISAPAATSVAAPKTPYRTTREVRLRTRAQIAPAANSG